MCAAEFTRRVVASLPVTPCAEYGGARSSHCLFIASNRPQNEYNRVSFLHAILCYHKSTDSVTFSIDSDVTNVRMYINFFFFFFLNRIICGACMHTYRNKIARYIVAK